MMSTLIHAAPGAIRGVARWLVPVLALTIAGSPAVAQDLADLTARAEPSVVALKVFDSFGNPKGEGTGFFLSEGNGLLVTNHHVIEGGRRIVAELADGRSLEISQVLTEDKAEDLALIQVGEGPFPTGLPLAGSPARKGEDIFVLGNPLGFASTVSPGIISGIHDQPDKMPDDWPHKRPVIQITAPISPGSSGSPVMNLRGEVLGVAVSMHTAGQNLNFAVPADAVKSLVLRARSGETRPARQLGGGIAGQLGGRGALIARNLGISLLFFGGLFFAFRRLR